MLFGRYDTGVLHGWRDEIDGALYAVAEARFKSELSGLGLSLEACRRRTCQPVLLPGRPNVG